MRRYRDAQRGICGSHQSAIAERFVSDLLEDSLVQSVQSAENSGDLTGQLSLRLDF
jgi:hypothetical protein